MKETIPRLFSDERPLIVLPILAAQIGLEETIIMQQLHYLLRDERNGKTINEKRWIYNTYESWQDHFPWMNLMKLRRLFTRLERWGYIESCQPEGRMSRRKYYRIIYESFKMAKEIDQEQLKRRRELYDIEENEKQKAMQNTNRTSQQPHKRNIMTHKQQQRNASKNTGWTAQNEPIQSDQNKPLQTLNSINSYYKDYFSKTPRLQTRGFFWEKGTK